MYNGELDTELGFFEQHCKEWLQEHGGEFALIKGTTLHGFYATAISGFEAGLQCIGHIDMLERSI